MGVFSRFFGESPRVLVLEAFAENPQEELSVPEIVEMTAASKRAVYMHVEKLLEEGVILKSGKRGKCNYYRLNEADPRGKTIPILEQVFVLGSLERRIREDEGIPLDQPFPYQRLYPGWKRTRPELEIAEVFAEAFAVANPFQTRFILGEPRIHQRTSWKTPERRSPHSDVSMREETPGMKTAA